VRLAFLDRVPLAIIFVGLFLAMVATWVVGRYLGVAARERTDDDSRSHASGLLGAMLGLLALLLGFTFSMAAQRFEASRDLVAREASAIDTAYRRADIAAEPERRALREALRRYLDTRLAFYEAQIDLGRRAVIEEQSARLEAEMWRCAMTTAAARSTPTTALLVEAVDQVFDVHTMRVHAAVNYVPTTIVWLLMIMAAASTGLTGYVAGFGNRRHAPATAIVLLLISLVIVEIVDLNRPMRGLIRGGQDSLLDLQKSLRAPVTATL
jgi:hypothetical protein